MNRVVREQNRRDVLRKRSILQRKQGQYNKNGLNAEQLRERLIRTQTQTNSTTGITPKSYVRPVGKKAVTRRSHQIKHKPKKEAKNKFSDTRLKLLIDVPNIGTKMSVVYPTPDWFIYQEKADVSVVVPLYKSQAVVKDLIASWDTKNDDLKVEMIFVDDNCPNDSKNAVIREWEKRKNAIPNGIGKVIFNNQNKGYGGSCNTGAEHASGDYIIYLNADTRVTSGWIKPIIEAFKNDPKAGIVGNIQLKDGGTWHGTIDSAGSEWVWKNGSFLHIGRHSYNGKSIPHPWKLDQAPKDILQTAEREMVTGCCLAIRSELNKKIGGFNPNFRVGYWEDSDICLTVREKGWKVLFEPKSIIYHKLGHTNSGGHIHHDFNQTFFWNKWVDSGRIDPLITDKRPNAKKEIRRILIQRKAAHGDVLVASHVCNALKRMYPGCQVEFYTDCPDILIGSPHIKKIHTSRGNFSERQFQLIYNLDMVYEYRPYTNILEAYADAVGVKVENNDIIMGTEVHPQTPRHNFVVVHAGKTNWVGRNWDRRSFEEICTRLMNEGKFVVCVGNKNDFEMPCNLDLRGRTNIQQLAHVISKSDLFIGIDSMPFHVAQTMHTKSVCYFGSILPETRIYRDNVTPVSLENLPCIGCHHRKSRPAVVTNVCETGTLDCENQLTTEYFWSKVKKAF